MRPGLGSSFDGAAMNCIISDAMKLEVRDVYSPAWPDGFVPTAANGRVYVEVGEVGSPGTYTVQFDVSVEPAEAAPGGSRPFRWTAAGLSVARADQSLIMEAVETALLRRDYPNWEVFRSSLPSFIDGDLVL